MGIQPTASRTTLLLNCQLPFSDAIDFEEFRNEDGVVEGTADEGARYGSAFHALMEKAPLNVGKKFLWEENGSRRFEHLVEDARKKYSLTRSVGEELAGHVKGSLPVLQKWLAGKNRWSRKFKVKRLKREVARAYDVFGSNGHVKTRHIRLPRAEDHFYEDLRPREVAGTSDLEDEGGVDESLFLDHKTGHDDADFARPSRNDQLRTLSLVDGDVNRDTLVAIFHADRRGLPIIHAGEVTVHDRARHAKRLRKALRRVGDGSMRPAGVGVGWCRYCPARSVCPTQTGGLLQGAAAVVTDAAVALARVPKGGITKPEDVGRMHLFFSEIDRLKRVAWPAMKAFVKNIEPGVFVQRPQDGKVLRIETHTEERLSKSAIVEALGAREAARLFDKLREAGALKPSEVEKLVARFPD